MPNIRSNPFRGETRLKSGASLLGVNRKPCCSTLPLTPARTAALRTAAIKGTAAPSACRMSGTAPPFATSIVPAWARKGVRAAARLALR